MLKGYIQLPHRIIRGTHGPYRLAVLCAVMSRGKCWASASTLAKDIGCNEKTVRKAFQYWRNLHRATGWPVWEQQTRKGSTHLIRVSFPGTSISSTASGAQDGEVGFSDGSPRFRVPTTNNPQENSNKKAMFFQKVGKKRAFIEGCPAYKDPIGNWMVINPNGERRTWVGPMDKLEWR